MSIRTVSIVAVLWVSSLVAVGVIANRLAPVTHMATVVVPAQKTSPFGVSAVRVNNRLVAVSMGPTDQPRLIDR